MTPGQRAASILGPAGGWESVLRGAKCGFSTVALRGTLSLSFPYTPECDIGCAELPCAVARALAAFAIVRVI